MLDQNLMWKAAELEPVNNQATNKKNITDDQETFIIMDVRLPTNKL